MGIDIVRKPSEVPNITIPDDCRMMRYAVGGYNGYVLNYLEQCGYVVSGRNFTIKSGELVIDGYQIEIDQSGVTITVLSSSSTYYYSVYAEIDLQIPDSPIASIKATYSLDDYPVIQPGEDLTTNPSGVARLLLYRFTVTNGEISNVSKVVAACLYNSARFNNVNSQIANINQSITNINNRLNDLGFSSATATIYACENSDGSGNLTTVGIAYFYRLGRFVICRLYSTVSVSYLPYNRLPYLTIRMSNQLKSFVRSVTGTFGNHYVNQNSTHTIGGKGTIARQNGNTNGSILIDCYSRVTITSDSSATNFLTSEGAQYSIDTYGNYNYITMKQFDVALGWLCVNPES